MSVLALGVSYRRASVDLLERLAVAEEDEPKAYQHLLGMPGVEEGVIVSTCNRVEVHAEVAGYHEGFTSLKRFLSESREVPMDEFTEPLYAHYEDDAAEHLFSVVAGLDSMVVGEPQILSQVRDAFHRAREEGACGTALSPLFRYALRAGRRARDETEIGASPGAFVDAGAALAADHLGGLDGRSVLVIGAGEMGSLAVSSLAARNVGRFRVLNRTPERAERLASRVGGTHGSMDDVGRSLAGADLVVSSTGSTRAIVSREAVDAATAGRRSPIFFLDLAVPRDVEPSVRQVPGARVADLDDLRGMLVESRAGIAEQIERARELLAEEASRYRTQRRAAQLAPLIAALHARGEDVRAAELERIAPRLSTLTERQWEAVEALTKGIVKTLLHDPVVRLKERWGAGLGEAHARTLAELFGLRRGPGTRGPLEP